MIEYDKFKKSLKHLELQFENYKGLDTTQPELIQEAVSESVIQRFEICYDCMWKVLKRYLQEELGIPEVPNSPKPIIRLGYENDLFASTLEQWISYADARIGTSHDYSGEKAEDALGLMGDFIDDAIGLYQTMSGETWE
ncbi:MAG: nucleotidyltransferase [Planctomycetaceae bacterium]|mgnify:CR=1 FL=1|jgi:nucleotidyltransferase substrate binding protein (TIGR01987 family)|nr:nucleotidyltransferase [Planctomycetaceae bacterium]MBT3878939.1 nucleotidyltransferase [Candidatus Scalindua sp.]MBT5306234.1 nucleotidyltransferase [Candidatus Scalindua sp.]MBT6562372.1 nucleotidyltransferase [Candidatus Scalindua sp.]MBT7213051.1 nucleotidyltransferase [Candidatus Scalindua sp.]